MAALKAQLRGGSELLRRCLLEHSADEMKADAESHHLTWWGAETAWLKRQLWGRW